eukprot:TRINITY_DN19314_c0_g1_i1.p1 TRINITY_DN19314_c0_g1~~TRINITY_DN19314_c0_g1_i1.p1  ORF type:complete len:188 (+),score=17.87 TRINITY_DN19314_c0_g1_i1:33-596(+)
MGNWFGTDKQMEGWSCTGDDIKDRERVGDLYLLCYDQGSEANQTVQSKRAHHTLVLDVCGESTENRIIGSEFHMGLSKTAKAVYKNERRDVTKQRLISHHYLGKLVNLGGDRPTIWASIMSNHAFQLFKDMVFEQGNDSWTAKLNCQQFTRRLAAYWGIMNYPVEVIGDEAPVLVDLTLSIMAACMK